MIEKTLLHLPGVGHATERRLWEAGCDCWDSLWDALRSGSTARELLHGSRQLTLFPTGGDSPADARSLAWMDCLDQSRLALREKRYAYFLELLKPANHWRLLGSVSHEALYLDIETTGLSSDLHYVTVVGALYQGKFYQWSWPEPLNGLAELIQAAPLIVTFNGRRFDVPFLRAKAPELPVPRAHVDLLYIARAAGFKGGQKQIEQDLGLCRDEGIRGLDGAEAVACWCSALYGNRSDYHKLLSYNRADVEMMPEIARKFCEILSGHAPSTPPSCILDQPTETKLARKAASFAALQRAWHDRRPGLHQFEAKLESRFGRTPIVVGIDLRAKVHNPTGWAVCAGAKTKTHVVYTDEEILDLTLAAKPDLVSIDAPLSLPRGRTCVSDDSPCRKTGGIVRDAERILWSRGIRVYPALLRQMQGLTQRGIELTRKLEAKGIRVIESYPGAAQDILNIPRKKLDESLLRRGLSQFGYHLSGQMTHDELDAITSALVGQYYLADQYEAIGADDEGYMVIPRSSSMTWTNAAKLRRRVVSVVGLPGAGKTTLTRALAQRLGWRSFVLGDALRERAAEDTELNESLARGEMAPEPVVLDLIREAVRDTDSSEAGLFIDGFPRHKDQIKLASQLFSNWTVVCLNTDPCIATQRLANRIDCGHCGLVTSREVCKDVPCPSCGHVAWHVRQEDSMVIARRRLAESGIQLRNMLASIQDVRVVGVDASAPMNDVADDVVCHVLATRLG